MNQINRRRTFAIISHPDAGKTTLTEKLLLYGGAVHLAGAVTARKSQRATASDWMELEKKRGISISSTVLQFDYNGFRINLLDTPGHKDFSEDTYRVLTAVDAVIMVIDAGNGIESQTRKLFEVCRQRRVPIFTFMNKMDRPSKEPLALIDELETALNLRPYPFNWPIGDGIGFKGLYDRGNRQAHLFERTVRGASKAPVEVRGLSDLFTHEGLDRAAVARAAEEIDVLEHAGHRFSADAVLAGDMTPVFFGSAANNVGVQLLLDGFIAWSAPPGPRRSTRGVVDPASPFFSGFVFKIQGNMDPRHRDQLAFVRVCSGKFSRDMTVHHSGTGKSVKLTYSHRLFGQERETIDEADPGDVIGLVGHPEFKVGDTLTEAPGVVYREIPRFPPECFAYLHNPNPSKSKSFRKGLSQLLLEGIVQSFSIRNAPTVAPLLAAVGPLQFEVLKYRLETEYGVPTRLETAPWNAVRWTTDDGRAAMSAAHVLPPGASLGEDSLAQPVVFFPEDWSLRYFRSRHPGVELHEVAPQDRFAMTALVPTERKGIGEKNGSILKRAVGEAGAPGEGEDQAGNVK